MLHAGERDADLSLLFFVVPVDTLLQIGGDLVLQIPCEEKIPCLGTGALPIVELDEEINKYHEQLGNVSNSREYDSINKELENLGLLRDIAEKHINDARFAISEKKDAINVINDRIAIREEDLAAKKAELEGIVESTSKDEQTLTAKRKQFSDQLDERTLSAYDRIRASVHNHLAVVPVYEESCGGCFNAITPQKLVDIASGNKLVICENCGRILVNPLADVEA